MSLFLSSIVVASTDVIPVTTQGVSQFNSVIVPVTPEFFAQKITASGNVLLQVIGSFVVPIVSIGIMISIIVYIVGAMFHADKVRKAGATGIGSCILGFFIYMMSPSIMGILYTIWQIFK